MVLLYNLQWQQVESGQSTTCGPTSSEPLRALSSKLAKLLTGKYWCKQTSLQGIFAGSCTSSLYWYAFECSSEVVVQQVFLSLALVICIFPMSPGIFYFSLANMHDRKDKYLNKLLARSSWRPKVQSENQSQHILNYTDMMLFNILQPPFEFNVKLPILCTNFLHIKMNCNHVDDPWTISLMQSSVQLLNYTCKTCKNKGHLITLSANGQKLYSISVQMTNHNCYGQKLLILLLS